MKFKLYFRPFPFRGIVSIRFDSEGWWITGHHEERHRLGIAAIYVRLSRTKRASLTLLWLNIAYWWSA